MSQEEEKRRPEIKKEILKDKRFIKVFEGYDELSVERFVNEYARYKAILECKGNYVLKRASNKMAFLMEKAQACLKEIQLKKLFDIECQWRANLIKLPDVYVTYDFKVIAENIHEASIVAPICKEDIHMYRDYLHSQYNNFIVWDSHEDYNYVKELFELEEDNKENYLSGYFRFHNDHTGAWQYISLPDIRGEKEHFYITIKSRGKNVQPSCTDETHYKPYLFAFYENLAIIAQKMGDQQFARYFKRSDFRMNRDDGREEDAFWYLYFENETIPIPSSHDWGKALIEAAKRHQSQQVANLLTQVWEELKMKREMNIPVEQKDSISFADLRDKVKQDVLNGRELNGESRDFDF